MSADSATGADCQEDFLPPVPLPMRGADMNDGTTDGFFLFLSALGFFFSRLLLI